MPVFTPGHRWQPPFMPFKREPFKKRALAKIEIIVKGPLFGCRMCGNCLLQETAFICPMECPKGLRNGPCGGSTPKNVMWTKPVHAFGIKFLSGHLKLGREEQLMEVLPPLDWDKAGTDSWGDVYEANKKNRCYKNDLRS